MGLIDLNVVLEEVFNQTLIREQLSADGCDTSDETVLEVYHMKQDNPWDAYIMWRLTKLAKEIYGEQSN